MVKHKSIQVMKGVTIYSRDHSQYYTASVYNPETKRYHRVSTGCNNIRDARLSAIEIAQKYFLNGIPKPSAPAPIPTEHQMKYLADEMLKKMPDTLPNGKKNYSKIDAAFIINKDGDGIHDYFGATDITTLKKRDIMDWLDEMDANRDEPLSSSSKTKYMVTLKKIINHAYDRDILSQKPEMPSVRLEQKPRPAFTAGEIMDIYLESYKCLGKKVGDVRIHETFLNLCMFAYSSFIRPTVGELFSLKFEDCEIMSPKDRPQYIKLKVNGKTGMRITHCHHVSVDVLEHQNSLFERLYKRKPKPDDYLFFPDVADRNTAAGRARDMFRALLDKMEIRTDSDGRRRSLYSIRHSSIQHILANGDVEVFDLAKNAGTSVQMIEKFYTKYMGLSDVNARNLFRSTDVYGLWPARQEP